MTRKEALTRLKNILGSRGRYNVGRHVTSPEGRAAAAARYESLKGELAALQDEIETKYGAQLRAIKDAMEKASTERNAYKFWVGKEEHRGFCIERAKGDTWEEVFEALRTSKPDSLERLVQEHTSKTGESGTPF